VVFHFLEMDFDKDGIYSFEFFVDQQLRFSLYLTYALNEKYRLFIAPMGIAFFEKNNSGFLYGCQGGMRVSFEDLRTGEDVLIPKIAAGTWTFTVHIRMGIGSWSL